MPTLHHGDLTVTSPAFDNGAAIPRRFTSDGDDVSPPLRWTAVPDGTRELVLIVHDPDAPIVGGFTHWVAIGIDPAFGGFDEGSTTDGVVEGTNSSGQPGYMGPAPPEGHGVHHYFFHLYALDDHLDVSTASSSDDVARALYDHVIEQARLVGVYER